jgi:hypothetical protein
VELNIYVTKFCVSPKDFEVFQLFGPATAVSRSLRGDKKLEKPERKPENRPFPHKKVKLVDIR